MPSKLLENEGTLTNEGLVKFHFINLQADTMATTKDYNFRVWAKDSSVIVENNWVKFDLAPTKGTAVAYLKTISFSYYNLTTSTCESYPIFSPKIKPEFSFNLSDSDVFSFDFTGKNITNTGYLDSLTDYSDTLWLGNIYKRKQLEKMTKGYSVKDIFYFRKLNSDLVFHLNPGFDLKYFPYRLFRVDSYVNGELVRISEMELERNYLTDYEKRIFKAWERNLKSCKEFSSYLQFEKFCANKLETDKKIK